MATERTLLTRSVTTRTPLGSVLSLCSASGLLKPSAISACPVPGTAGAAIAAARTVGTAVARGALAAALASTAAPSATAGADCRKLLDALAGDIGILGHAQPNA